MDNSGGTGLNLMNKDIDIGTTPRILKPPLQSFRNITYARENKDAHTEGDEEENADPSGRLLLTDRPRLFPDFENPKLFPRFDFKSKRKAIIKPYLHNMSYHDLMEWRKKNYCKIYNQMTTRITK